MYADYYNLTESPFENTPDPLFLYLSKQHREVLSALLYGIESAKGFVLVSGEVGTGKTTLIRALLEKIPQDSLVINIINPRNAFEDVFELLVKRLGLTIDGENHLEIIEKVRGRLEALNQEGRRVVLLVDEAHLLSEDSLQDIRLLSNIENEKCKLIQIIMVGQNEIHDLLERDSQKSLKQRIVINRQLHPLDRDETTEYIKHRLLVAGRQHQLFDDGAHALIRQKSQGIPRLINQICDNALLIGYALEAPLIDRKIIKEVINDMAQAPARNRIAPLSCNSGSKTWAIAGGVALLILVIGGYFYFKYGTGQFTVTSDSPLTRAPFRSSAFADGVTSETDRANGNNTEFQRSSPFMPDHKDQSILASKNGFEADHIHKPVHIVSQSNVPALHDELNGDDSIPQSIMEDVHPDRVKMPEREITLFSKDAQPDLYTRSQKIKPNDWLASIAFREYGSNSGTVIDLIQTANKNIKNINRIYHGQKITLPRITRDSMIVEGEGNNFHVHYASFYNFKDARLVTQKLLGEGKKAFLVPSRQGENQVFRVYMGIFPNRNQAEKAVRNLEFEYLPFL